MILSVGDLMYPHQMRRKCSFENSIEKKKFIEYRMNDFDSQNIATACESIQNDAFSFKIIHSVSVASVEYLVFFFLSSFAYFF